MSWEFSSHAQLAQAGWLFQTRLNCRRCRAQVLLYRAPQGFRLALECESFRPHRERCEPVRPRKDSTAQGALFGGSDARN